MLNKIKLFLWIFYLGEFSIYNEQDFPNKVCNVLHILHTHYDKSYLINNKERFCYYLYKDKNGDAVKEYSLFDDREYL